MGEKTCGRCTETKLISEFRIMKEKRRLNGEFEYRCSVCKECEKKRALEKYHENKAVLQEQNRLYKQNNKDKINDTRRAYTRTLMMNPSERIKRNMKSLISTKINKTRHTGEYLGADMSIIVKWLEYNMSEEMSWDNYGTFWHIDHTIPINSFNVLEENEMMLCFSWMNLMPLEKIRNLKKSDNLNVFRVWHQERQLREFSKKHKLCEDISTFLQQYSDKLGLLLCMQHT